MPQFPYAAIGAQYSLLRVLVAAIVLAVATPAAAGVVSFRVDEFSEAEVEFTEKLEEALRSQRVLRIRRRKPKCWANSYRVSSIRRLLHSNAPRPVEGHRLSNGLLAPLTC